MGSEALGHLKTYCVGGATLERNRSERRRLGSSSSLLLSESPACKLTAWPDSVATHSPARHSPNPSRHWMPSGRMLRPSQMPRPSHRSGTMHGLPSSQDVLAATNASGGQAPLWPVQTSSSSHWVCAARQGVFAVLTGLAGQTAAAPSHVATFSQSPCASRHGVAAGFSTFWGQVVLSPSQNASNWHAPEARAQA